MKNLFVTFQAEQLRHVNCAVAANAAQIIALKVGNHDQLRDFF